LAYVGNIFQPVLAICSAFKLNAFDGRLPKSNLLICLQALLSAFPLAVHLSRLPPSRYPVCWFWKTSKICKEPKRLVESFATFAAPKLWQKDREGGGGRMRWRLKGAAALIEILLLFVT